MYLGKYLHMLTAIVGLSLINALLFLYFSSTEEVIIVFIVAFLASDLITALFVGSGGRIPIMGQLFRRKGYVFLSYYASIIVSSLVAGAIADFVTQNFSFVLNGTSSLQNILIVMVAVAGLLYFKMNKEVYRR